MAERSEKPIQAKSISHSPAHKIMRKPQGNQSTYTLRNVNVRELQGVDLEYQENSTNHAAVVQEPQELHEPHEHDQHCQHDHDHHEHDEHCECHGHDYHDHHEPATSFHASETHKKIKGKTKIYKLQNLGCAHCAAKMEYAINQLDSVSDCVLVFETKQLHVTAKNPDALLPDIRRICSSIESEAKVLEPEETVEEDKSAFAELCIGAGCFIAGLLCRQSTAQFTLFATAYLLLGWRVLATAARNLIRGQVFDENFLMSLATIGAIGIQQYSEAVGVMLFYRIGEYLEDKAVEHSRKQIMSAVDLRPEVVALDNGVTVPAEEVQVGDMVIVRPGDRIPLDGVVVEGNSRLDTSAVTGEPVPVAVQHGDNILSGCVNTDGLLRIRVTHSLRESLVQRILDSVENAAAQKPKLDRFITRFSRIYTPVVVGIALLTVLIPGFLTGNWSRWLYTALTFLVISCPCALVLSVPLSYFSGIGVGSRQGILLKGGAALEVLENVKAVVMDKTGTITQGNFAVQKITAFHGWSEEALLSVAAACESRSSHPIAQSVLRMAKERKSSRVTVGNIHERAGEGVEALWEGQSVLCGNRKLLERHGVDCIDYQENAGCTDVLLAVNGEWIGYLSISDTVKPEAPEAAAQLKRQGVSLVMLTGDNAGSANDVAQKVGISEVYSRLLPQEKLEKLKEIREKYGAVLFVGDGMNDAPVLAGADVGAAMGSGADAAMEAADVVFMNSNLLAVPTSITIAKKTGRTARQNIAFALAVKIAVMALGLAGIASMWLAVFADSGVALLCVLHSIHMLFEKDKKQKNIKIENIKA